MSKLDRTDRIGLFAFTLALASIILLLFFTNVPAGVEGLWEYYTKPDDSIAQWLMTAISVMSVALTAIGVWYIAKTLSEARKTTEAAIRGAEAASRANEVTKQAFISDQRPWINVDIEIVGDLVFNNDGLSTEVRMTSTNFGKSPATGVFTVLQLAIEEPNQFEDLKVKMMVHWTNQQNLRVIDSLNWGRNVGNAVFPDRQLTRTQQLSAGKELSEKWRAQGEIMLGILVACTYGPTSDSGYYATVKMFHVNGPGDKQKVNPIRIPIDGVIIKHDIHISEVFSATYLT